MVNSSFCDKVGSFKVLIGTTSIPSGEFVVVTDSRKYSNGNGFFVALSGPNFDGFKFIPDVIKLGCQLVAFTGNEQNTKEALKLSKIYPEVSFIAVEDSLKYLQELARLHITNWRGLGTDRRLIGITGSNGKTTTKEMLFHFLNAVIPGKVYCTRGNLNNHIGVPLSLLSVSANHQYAIIEMGSNHLGEISGLCEIAEPTDGIITSIGGAHLEFFQTEENVFIEKSALYNHVVKNSKGAGFFVVDGDDPYLQGIEDSAGLTTFGEKNGKVKVTISQESLTINYGDSNLLIKNQSLLGKYNYKNLAASFILASKFFSGQIEELVTAAVTFLPGKNRSSWIKEDDKSIFLDAYNANPVSMRESLGSFMWFCKQQGVDLKNCLFVIGDMNELGEFTKDKHQEIGRFLKEIGAINVIFVGRFRDYYLNGFGEGADSFESTSSLLEEWASIKSKYQFFFLKGSRTLELEKLCKA